MKLDDALVFEQVNALNRMCLEAAQDIKLRFMPMQKYCGEGEVHVSGLGERVTISVRFPDQEFFSETEIQFRVEFLYEPSGSVTASWMRVYHSKIETLTIDHPTSEKLLAAFYSLVGQHAQRVFRAAATKDHWRLSQLLR